jgi:uncharacterized protein
MFQFNPLSLLVILPGMMAWVAQGHVQRTYREYEQVPNTHGASGMHVARQLLSSRGLGGVQVEAVAGDFTDHYDATTKTLRLSQGNAEGGSVAALGVVAHEVGHAAQDAEGYPLLRLRTTLSTPVQRLARLSPLVFIGGWLAGIPLFMGLGVVMLAALALFALVTLPVEKNASDRAIAMLKEAGTLMPGEDEGVRRVLRAAALTYAAGFGRQLSIFLFYLLVIVAARGLLPA